MIEEIKETLNSDAYNVAYSENGAKMYRTTGKCLLDLFFKVPMFRKYKAGALPKDGDLYNLFMPAFAENRELFAKFMFFLRDARGGVGERDMFRNIFLWFSDNYPQEAVKVIRHIPNFGRWDDLVFIAVYTNDESVSEIATNIIKAQLEADMNTEHPSLLAKWMPSANAGNKAKSEAKVMMRKLELISADYRRMLSALRKKIDIVETHIASKSYGDIDYEKVPSVANTRYANLFLKYDETRRRSYLDALVKGEAKINASAVFPHDIYKKCGECGCDKTTINEMWKALPDFVDGDMGTLVVRDGSGSMTVRIANSTTTALDIASALCVYFSERMTGEFKDKFITFSDNPRLVDLSNGKDICEKYRILKTFNECSSTDIEKTFDLVLDTAVRHKIPQSEMPRQILIISDMEFNYAHSILGVPTNDEQLFTTIAKKYADAGYKLPKCVFWNVNSRTGAIPMKENEQGVVLVAGYSPAICKMVLTEEVDPYLALVKELMGERYSEITLG